MKKQIALATVAVLVTSSAYATKARMQALGQSQDTGSFYIKDTRNIFKNPAGVNSMKNYVVTEWGTAAATVENNAAPAAEGGFFREMGAFAYGVYLGNDYNSQNAIRNGAVGYANKVANGSANFVDRDNELELFFGGDMGVEWGIRVMHATAKVEPSTTVNLESKQSTLGLGLGVSMGAISAYLNMDLKDESEGLQAATTGATWESDGVMRVGAAYEMGNMTIFADYNKKGAKFVAATGTAANETSQTVLQVGVGHTKEVSSTSRIFTNFAYKSTKAEDKDGTTAINNTELNDTALPLTVGFEADATSWLTLRGSITSPVFINSRETKTTAITHKKTQENQTDVAAGATLNFGKLKVDGVIGTAGNAGTNAVAGETGVLALDRLMTRVAVHYWF
jgi:hypothetical protein